MQRTRHRPAAHVDSTGAKIERLMLSGALNVIFGSARRQGAAHIHAATHFAYPQNGTGLPGGTLRAMTGFATMVSQKMITVTRVRVLTNSSHGLSRRQQYLARILRLQCICSIKCVNALRRATDTHASSEIAHAIARPLQQQGHCNSLSWFRMMSFLFTSVNL